MFQMYLLFKMNEIMHEETKTNVFSTYEKGDTPDVRHKYKHKLSRAHSGFSLL